MEQKKEWSPEELEAVLKEHEGAIPDELMNDVAGGTDADTDGTFKYEMGASVCCPSAYPDNTGVIIVRKSIGGRPFYRVRSDHSVLWYPEYAIREMRR